MLAVIGGSGLNHFPGVKTLEQIPLETPYGAVSSGLLKAEYQGSEFIFLPRHGLGHKLAPHQINYRANLWALRQLGVTSIIAANAVGGMAANMGPGALVIPDQIIDYTYGREQSFVFDVEGYVNHIDFTYPYSEKYRNRLLEAATSLQLPCVFGGTYACTQGPRLETAAEVKRLVRDGCDLVGMTAMPEAALARELKMEYAAICLVVNWAAGLGDGLIDFADIDEILKQGMEKIQKLLIYCLCREN